MFRKTTYTITIFGYRSKGPKTKGLVDTGPSDIRPSGQKAQLTKGDYSKRPKRHKAQQTKSQGNNGPRVTSVTKKVQLVMLSFRKILFGD